jgi:methionine synthase II (cobalamin-independent)
MIITTGIGSLPFVSLEQALNYSFAHRIPFLPELIQFDRYERMVPRILRHIPGYTLDFFGSKIDEEIFLHSLKDNPLRLNSIAFDSFIQRAVLENRKTIKLQFAGALTLMTSLRTLEGAKLENSYQVFQGILKLLENYLLNLNLPFENVMIMFDEPMWSINTDTIIDRQMVIRSYENFFEHLKSKTPYLFGFHICGDCLWSDFLNMKIDLISYDYWLSHQSISQLLLKDRPDITQLIGLIETHPHRFADHNDQYKNLIHEFKAKNSNLNLSTNCGLGLAGEKHAQDVLNLFLDL